MLCGSDGGGGHSLTVDECDIIMLSATQPTLQRCLLRGDKDITL